MNWQTIQKRDEAAAWAGTVNRINRLTELLCYAKDCDERDDRLKVLCDEIAWLITAVYGRKTTRADLLEWFGGQQAAIDGEMAADDERRQLERDSR